MPEPSPSTPDTPDLRVRTYVGRWFHALFAFDGPTWQALRLVVRSPGRLAALQLEPEKTLAAARVHPVRLYLVINVLFFLVAPYLNNSNLSVWDIEHKAVLVMQPAFVPLLGQAVEDSGFDEALFGVLLDRRMRAQQGSLVWMLIPVLALGTFVVSRRRRRFLAEHLIHATNLVSFFLLATLLMGLVVRLILLAGANNPTVLISAAIVVIGFLVWVPVVFYLSVRAFFETGWWRSIPFTLWLFAAFFFGFWLYLQALFLLGLFGLRGLVAPVAG